MELSLPFPSLHLPIKPQHVCISSSVALLYSPNGRIACMNASSFHQTGAFFLPGVSSCRKCRVKAGESVSTSLEEGDESPVASGGSSKGGGALEGGEESKQKLHEDFQEKADMIFNDAIKGFFQSDIEEASKKYDMEEDLFAEIDFAQINAFTQQPFSGNPAAVCYLPLKRSDEWLQLVAREFNLSNTAFLVKRDTRKKRSTVFKKSDKEQLAEEKSAFVDEFDLRWFTPKIEVDLCGHATLASAHLLFASGIAAGDTIIFHTKSGVLKAKRVSGYDEAKVPDTAADLADSGKDSICKDLKIDYSEDLKTEKKRPIGVGTVELDFPMDTFTKCNGTEAEDLSAALGGVKLLWAGKTSLGNYLAEVSCSEKLKQLQPDFNRLLNLPGKGIIVTAPGDKDSGLDFVSRYFAPKAGVMEDPVTGSAHCSLGPFWAERLGKLSLKAYQASDRGGYIQVYVDRNEGRVYIQGSAVLVMAGVLLNTMRA